MWSTLQGENNIHLNFKIHSTFTAYPLELKSGKIH